ncbi:MAG: phosphatidate cytidylyltransferase [Oscillospiraceae bacterium]|nr:phosphatidate cytidylyltransferase [Oscillospiraceae bacterium]
MKQRWLVAVIGLPLLLLILLYCPVWATMLLVTAVSSLAAYELLKVAGKNVSRELIIITAVFAAAQVITIYCRDLLPEDVPAMFFGPLPLILSLFAASVITYGKNNAVGFSTVSAGIVGGAFFPAMYGCILLLRMHDSFGRVYVLAPFFTAFAGDSLAMYFGKWFGKKKMAPHVSPNKTWAGFYGNMLGSALGMLLLGLIGSRFFGYTPNYIMLALVGIVSNVFGQLGDLSTSLIKREAGVKDYSRLFLTHGGVLDRFDSTLFIAPVIYLFVCLGII